MIRAKLVRRAFPDRPDWVLVDASVPLDTLYYVLSLEERTGAIVNLETGEERQVSCLLVYRPGGSPGWIPTDVLQVLES